MPGLKDPERLEQKITKTTKSLCEEATTLAPCLLLFSISEIRVIRYSDLEQKRVPNKNWIRTPDPNYRRRNLRSNYCRQRPFLHVPANAPISLTIRERLPSFANLPAIN
jgi:hypothetical protein